MRSYKVYGIKDGGAEEYVATVYSAAEGKTVQHTMIVAEYYDTMIVRDCLGGVQIRRELKKEAA